MIWTHHMMAGHHWQYVMQDILKGIEMRGQPKHFHVLNATLFDTEYEYTNYNTEHGRGV